MNMRYVAVLPLATLSESTQTAVQAADWKIRTRLPAPGHSGAAREGVSVIPILASLTEPAGGLLSGTCSARVRAPEAPLFKE